jgi:hypothetical protein
MKPQQSCRALEVWHVFAGKDAGVVLVDDAGTIANPLSHVCDWDALVEALRDECMAEVVGRAGINAEGTNRVLPLLEESRTLNEQVLS